MRILLWYWGRRGGGARITLELARALAAHGGVQPLLGVAHGNELGPALRSLGVPMREDWVHPPRIGAAWLPGPWSLGAWARRERVDVVVQVMGHPLSWPAAITVRRAGVALVDFVHDATPHPGDHQFAYDLSVARTRRIADRLVALSDHVRTGLVADGVPGERIAVIPHGPLFEGTPPAVRPAGDPLVLFFGRIRAYKGLDLLLAAWPSVLEQVPNATLRIAGEGVVGALPQHLPRVEVVSRWFGDAEVPEVVGAASVVVLPYTEASQSGVVTIAQSLGVPVVATRVGGLAEQVTEGVDGFLCDPSAPAIAAAIVRALTYGPSFDRGNARVAATSWTVVADRLIAECATVLSGRQS